MDGSLNLGVLGPVRGWRGGVEVDLGTPQQRIVLSALLLHAGSVVAPSYLVGVLWPEQAPATAINTVRTYVSRLRRVLEPATIESVPGGYSLRLDPEAVDLERFRAHVCRARSLHHEGRPEAALHAYQAALTLWDGPALTGLPGAWARAQRDALAELRFAADLERHAIRLGLGPAPETTAELTDLVRRHPLRERPRELLMYALHRDGRRAEAVATYRELHAKLTDELGIEPGPGLSTMYERIMCGNPALDAPEQPSSPPPVHRVPPEGDPQRAPLWIALLGPLRAWWLGHEIELGTPQQRAVLATLVLHRGTLATVDDLVRSIWGNGAPPGGVGTVRTYVSRLRRVISPRAERAGGPITSSYEGYTLPVEALSCDVTDFRRLRSRASTARRNGDLAGAAATLDEALRLVTGEPLTGVPGEYAEGQRQQLSREVLGARTERIDLDLGLGLHGETVAQLTALARNHPFDERLRDLHMRALYRTGRQAEALTVFHDFRRLLRRELNTVPGPEVERTHQRILRADPVLLRI
ncbi:AfsR/SARP family transcriptional regulator [Dactylosporangium sp. CA-233914]|uniref:AfsR/SARP family transcriptional regulator n=1 Tax=Dactylosporangium sp. CA-233914 TaxID=3239934 RepID=UPI003D91AB81